MKPTKFLELFAVFGIAAMTFAGCETYDDSELTGRVDDLENRVQALEERIEEFQNSVDEFTELINQFKLFELTLPYPADGPDAVEGGLTLIDSKTAELEPVETISYRELNEQNPWRM